MISKTLDEWKQEAEKLASIYYEMYASSLNDKRCSTIMRKNYCDASKSNWELKDTLAHIQKYGFPVSPNKCDACRRNDLNHNDKLQRVYNKYQRWINQAITNGFNAFVKNAEKSVMPVPNTERVFDTQNNSWKVHQSSLRSGSSNMVMDHRSCISDMLKEDKFVIVNNPAYKSKSKQRELREAAQQDVGLMDTSKWDSAEDMFNENA